MSSLSSRTDGLFIVFFTIISITSLFFLVPSTTAAAAYAGSFELPQTAATTLNGRRQSSPPPPPQQLSPPNVITTTTTTEACSNASVRADFGTACLKKAIIGGDTQQIGSSRKKISKSPIPGRSRYFAVKPMMVQQTATKQRKSSFGVKSPVLSARELYASKGYQPFPAKSVRTVSGNSINMLPPVLPANRFYRVGNNDKSNEQTSPPPPPQLPLTPIDPTALVTEDDEWRDAPEQIVSPTGLPQELPTTKFTHKPAPPHHLQSNLQQNNLQQQQQGQYSEELEMLRSLKRSLGVLSAQALNLKQRSALLYREARRRKLYFFDALLNRTHSFLTEKTDETRNALSDIDTAIRQIEVHHREAAALEALRRTFYFYQQEYNQPSYSGLSSSSSPASRSLNSAFTSRRMRKRNTSKVDPKEVDQLIMDALNHAKRMMSIVRELNEAMDEFEEQFNLPRFEPNRVLHDDNSVDGSSEHF